VNEVLVGAALPLAICLAIYVARRGRAGWKLLVLGPLAMMVSGMIGVIPDFPRLFHHTDTYFAWHRSRWCNLAWGHCWIDARPRIDDWAGWPAVAIVVGGLVIGAAYRELWLAERGR
jgi:hypothetical protein